IAENFISALSNITYQEISLAWGVDSNIEKLKKTLTAMKAVVLAAEQK
ncbi:hypothetical protein Goarm_021307, partial [Gossypium armourianum]|nr:hypothetical protein [Gossypium armourianum]